MEAFSDVFRILAGAPAIAGLFLAAVLVFLASDWRLSLAGLFLQYILIGLTLTRFVQAEVVVVKLLIGVVVFAILFLTGQRIQLARAAAEARGGSFPVLGGQVGWDAGPLGLPLRFLVVLLVLLAFVRLVGTIRLPGVPTDLTFVAFWLAGMGLVGLVLSGDPLRVAASVLTILAAFDLVYALLEPSLAMIGFFGALILLAALAFSHLAIVQVLGAPPDGPGGEAAEQ